MSAFVLCGLAEVIFRAVPVVEQQHLSSMAGRHYRLRVTTFALIGSGWRARMFLKVAHELGTIRCGGVVVRTPRRLDVPTFPSRAPR